MGKGESKTNGREERRREREGQGCERQLERKGKEGRYT